MVTAPAFILQQLWLLLQARLTRTPARLHIQHLDHLHPPPIHLLLLLQVIRSQPPILLHIRRYLRRHIRRLLLMRLQIQLTHHRRPKIEQRH